MKNIDNASRSRSDSSKTKNHLGSFDWAAEMVEKGYVQGPLFSSYDELAKWDATNQRSHVRTRLNTGYQVYFTDKQSYDDSELKSEPSINTDKYHIYNEPPF